MCRVRSNIALALVAVLLSADFASAQAPACKPGQPCYQGGTVATSPVLSTAGLVPHKGPLVGGLISFDNGKTWFVNPIAATIPVSAPCYGASCQKRK
jgi:hypothetical protein